jgi:hypothetical protein
MANYDEFLWVGVPLLIIVHEVIVPSLDIVPIGEEL